MLLAPQHAVGDDRPHAAGRRLRSQAEAVTAAIRERVHLLLDDVCHLADGPSKELRALDHRNPELAVAVGCEQGSGRRLDPLPDVGLLRQYVVHAPDGLD